MRFLFVCSHQIQNLIPLFTELNKKKGLNFKVLFWEKLSEHHYDNDFKQKINFNINFYENYNFHSLSIEKDSTLNFFSFKNHLRIIIKLSNFLIKQDYDVVLFYGYYPAHIISAIISKILGKKTIIRSISYNLGKKNILKKILRNFYYRFANLFFDEFWSVCKLNTDFYLNFGVDKKKITLINSSQITKQFVYKNNEDELLNKEKTLKSINLSKEKKIILYSGKFNKKKRPLFLIEAFNNSKLTDEWCLLLSGGGGFYHNDVLKLLEKNNSNKVKYIGYRDLKEMVNLYNLSDIVVLPSDYGETHGNTLMEAIQFGCALIVSDRVGLHHEITKEELGLVFKADNKSELSNHFEILTKDVDLLNKYKENGIKFSKNIKPDFVADKIFETLNK